MKVKEGVTTQRTPEPSKLRPGDSITVCVTHQIEIGGDSTWVKLEAGSYVGEEESGKDAASRVASFVNEAVLDAVKESVETVNNINQKAE